ncbi:hypothetical protein AC578_1293 [Pseudocercospora eumusae]|uniref:Uncharacterized protein n=1 Tax=Pseudocercospora eumusae TaxID=321146 RepID=A0A139HUV2_9PEZI|nr:hypothetical protein AC578_1293 [Pseudocercospora eumusae]
MGTPTSAPTERDNEETYTTDCLTIGTEIRCLHRKNDTTCYDPECWHECCKITKHWYVDIVRYYKYQQIPQTWPKSTRRYFKVIAGSFRYDQQSDTLLHMRHTDQINKEFIWVP